jgi:CDP-6-deoxy-D-xylo-4-hexulose-3-dehydrase
MRIRLHEPTWEPNGEEVQAALEVLNGRQVTSGSKVREFERAFAKPHRGVMVNSGSSANLLAIAALTNPACHAGLRPGDEVIVSALSWSTTVWPLVQHGLVPVIVDIDPETLCIDPNEVERAIGLRTRGIMPVHVYGNPCDLSALHHLVDGTDRILIEDCCEALGATWSGLPVGTVGHIGTFSFYFSHHMTTLEGGICVTRDDYLNDLMRILRAHGWTRDLDDDSAYREAYPDIDPRFLFVNAGYNLRATEVAAAMGLVQLGKLAGFVEKRRAAAMDLLNNFDPHSDRFATQKETSGGRSSWFGFPVIGKNDLTADADAALLRSEFERKGVETRSIICGNIARQPGMQLWPHRVVGDLKHADHVMRCGFSIPCHQNMTLEETDYIGNVLADFCA